MLQRSFGLKVLLAGATALVLAACANTDKKQPAVQEAPPPPVAQPEPAPQPTGPTPGSQEDLNATAGDRVLFGFDKYDLDDAAQATLRNQGEWLKKYPAVSVIVEGHADERGTREYNLALGERRANAAKNYLVALGIDAARLEVVSYGKERPAVVGNDESAHSQNRRAVLVVK